MTQANPNVAQTIIDELKNLCPDITHSIVFNLQGKVLANNEATAPEENAKLVLAIKNLSGPAQAIGGVKSLAIQGPNSQLNVLAVNNQYFATVSSRSANEKTVKSLTTVIMPTVLVLMQQSIPQTPTSIVPQTISPQQPIEIVSPSKSLEAISETSRLLVSSFSDVPARQFMVERLSGLLVASDTVRLNGEIIAKWADLYGDKPIREVHIETLDGETTTCKFKLIKEANHKAQGIIQIPDKLLQTLHTAKGSLVIVKPVIN